VWQAGTRTLHKEYCSADKEQDISVDCFPIKKKKKKKPRATAICSI